jgi:hypothetical protein
MNPIGKKGQSDTFKLLIAAVVAMAILAIVTAILTQIDVGAFDCVDSPLNELTTQITQAKTGIERMTAKLCLKEGEGFGAETLQGRIAGINTITFQCMPNAAVCSSGGPLSVESGFLRATSDKAQFAALINCIKAGGGTGDFDCTIQIRSPLEN